MVNPDERHITYYRHGEVALLLEPIGGESQALKDGTLVNGSPDSQPPLDAETLAALQKLFERVEVPLLLDAAGSARPAITGADHRERNVLPMRRKGLRVLQIVNLCSWIAYPMKEKRIGKLRDSIRDVAIAVNRLNMFIKSNEKTDENLRVGRYYLRAAGPNWLAMRFNG